MEIYEANFYQSLSLFTFVHASKLSHLGGVRRARQHHVSGAAWGKLHTRRAEAEHWFLSARGRSTAQNVLLPRSRDGGKDDSAR